MSSATTKCIAYDPADLQTCLLAPCPSGHVNVLHPDNSVSCVKLPENCFDELGNNLCALSQSTSPAAASCLLYKGVPAPTNKVCLVDDSMISCGVGEVPVLEIMKATGHARMVCRKQVHDELESLSTAAQLPDKNIHSQTTSPTHTPILIVEAGMLYGEEGEGEDEDEDEEDNYSLEDEDMYGADESPEHIVVVVTQPQSQSHAHDDISQALMPMIHYGGAEPTVA